jgi:uncharacterized membrane protein
MAGPLGLIDCILLVVAIARITHKLTQEQRDPTLKSFLAALFSAAVSVLAIAVAVSAALWIVASLSLIAFVHPKSVGVNFILLFIVLQVSALAGVVTAYFAGPSFSRFIWEASPDKSNEDQD